MWFDAIVQTINFRPTIDVMATMENSKCPNYIEFFTAPNSVPFATDFFTCTDLGIHKSAYCFPPKKQLAKALNHILKHFGHMNWLVIFHRWMELPLGVEKWVTKPNVALIDTPEDFFTVIPAEYRLVEKVKSS